VLATTLRPSSPASVDLCGVPSADIDYVWDQVVPYLQKALDRDDGLTDCAHIYRKLKSRDMQLWIAWDGDVKGAGITQVAVYPNGKVLQVLYASVETLSECLGWEPMLRAYARDTGCKYVDIIGRAGWRKIFPDYEVKHLTLRKRI